MKTMEIESGDLVMKDGDITLIEGTQEIAQSLYIALATFKGEWYQDEELGVERSKLLGKVTEPQVRSAVIESIGRETRVATIESLSIDTDPKDRKVYVSFKVRTIEGEVLEERRLSIA
ncbi:hypothetical protein AAV35_012645 [Salimicrobium jeotgali]|uniref:DUF2634 domain-containing protein n=1 Tax=Salimicrobium jeotgali TaxID=1230341 RepID=K2G7V4_9BACI|nr:hypothetical protein [Salimicrobium jeotgali]AKG05517.1 hypothetical protein AAV35_012645 [Salimicrobium jeotgali]EKE30497.1 hypothetical protein MJ3_13689 [Salimicrobium jeotgali]MBM7696646.1 phage baseplate assembly protein W [Salimicrobium jeotgali]